MVKLDPKEHWKDFDDKTWKDLDEDAKQLQLFHEPKPLSYPLFWFMGIMIFAGVLIYIYS